MAVADHTNSAAPSVRSNANQSQSQARDIFRVVQKRRLLVVLVAAAVMIAGGIFAYMRPREYSASALVLIHEVPPGFFWLEQDPNALPPPQTSVETQARLVETLDNAEKTSRELAEGEGAPGIAVDATEILDATTVDIEEPDILRIRVSSSRRNAVVPIANTLADVYVESARERSRSVFTEAGTFLQAQIEDTHSRIADLNEKYLALLKTGAIADVDLEIEGVQELLQTLRADRARAEQEFQQARESVDVLARAVAEEPAVERLPTREPNPQREGLQQTLAEQQRRLAELQARYTQEHPFVQEALDQVESARRALDSVPEEVDRDLYRPNPRHDEALVQYRSAQARIEGLTGQIRALSEVLDEVETRAKGLPRQQVAVNDIKAELDIARQAYRTLVDTLQDHQLRQASRTGIAELVDRASIPRTVTAPLLQILIFSLVLGFGCALALALLLEALDNTIRSPDEAARQTGLPLLGYIPLLEDTSPQVVTLSAPQSPASEAFRTLRSSVSFSLTDVPARSFLVASAIGGEGRSTVAANLAVVAAHAGQTVYLVDTDLRKPILANLFGCEPGKGLTNVLVGDSSADDVLQDTGIPGLHLIATGPLPPNPAELLDSARMQQLIDELHRRADVVIFDSPPSLPLADGVILSSKADRTILVAESGRVTVDAFREVVRRMESAHSSVLGLVLNRYRLPTEGYDQYFYNGPPPEAYELPEEYDAPRPEDEAPV